MPESLLLFFSRKKSQRYSVQGEEGPRSFVFWVKVLIDLRAGKRLRDLLSWTGGEAALRHLERKKSEGLLLERTKYLVLCQDLGNASSLCVVSVLFDEDLSGLIISKRETHVSFFWRKRLQPPP